MKITDNRILKYELKDAPVGSVFRIRVLNSQNLVSEFIYYIKTDECETDETTNVSSHLCVNLATGKTVSMFGDTYINYLEAELVIS